MWEMGGYGVFVWSSYGVVMLALLWLFMSSMLGDKRIQLLLKNQFRDQRTTKVNVKTCQ